MALRVLNPGRYRCLAALLDLADPPPFVNLRLYIEDITPTENDASIIYLDAEADYTGYAPQAVLAWGAITDIAAVAKSTAAPNLFQPTLPVLVGNIVYGYFVTASDDPDGVLWAERFTDGPFSMMIPGDSILLYAALSAESLFP